MLFPFKLILSDINLVIHALKKFFLVITFPLFYFQLLGPDVFFHFVEFYFIFLYSRFLLVIHFVHISVYMSIPISQFIPPPPHPTPLYPLVSIRLFSTSMSPFLPCKPVHWYHFSRFLIYALIFDICFPFLTYFTLYDTL